MTHPRPQFLVLGSIALLFSLFWGDFLVFFLGVSIVTSNLWVIGPYFFPADRKAIPKPTAELSVLLINTDKGSAKLKQLELPQADLLFLQEVQPEFPDMVTDLWPNYEVVRSHPMPNTHGSMILLHKDSTIEIIHSEIIYLPEDSVRPLITLLVQVSNRQVKMLNMHVTRPQHFISDAYQKIELNNMATWAQSVLNSSQASVVIVGDFNATPWSIRYRNFIDTSMLIDSMKG